MPITPSFLSFRVAPTFARAWLICCAIVWASYGFSQSTPGTETAEVVSGETIEAKLKELESAADLDEETRAKIREKYQEAAKALELARQWGAKAASYQSMIDSAPRELSQTRSELAALPEKPAAVGTDGTVVELERALSGKESALAEKRSELAELEAEAKRRAARRAEVPKLLDDARRRLAESEAELQTPQTSEESAYAAAARRTLAAAKRQAVEQEVLAYEREPKAYEARVEVLPLRRDLAVRQLASLEAEVAALREGLNRRRQSETEAQLRAALHEASLASPEIAAHLQQNAKLAERRTKLAAKIAETGRQLEQSHKTLASLQDQFARVREKEEAVGLTNNIGLWLRQQRDKLPDVRPWRESVAKRQSEIRDIRLELLELDDRRSELANLDGQMDDELESLGPDIRNMDRDELEAAIRDALETEKEYLAALIVDTNAYFDRLIELDMAQRRLIEETEKYQEYADERVLWIRSTSTLGLADLRQVTAGARRLAEPAAWLVLARNVGSEIRSNSLVAVSAALILAIILYARGRAKKQILLIGEKAARSTCCRAFPTLEAVFLTAFLASILPAILWCLAWRLSLIDSDPFWIAVAEGLFSSAGALFGLMFIYQACRRLGPAEAHFDWTSSAIRSLRRYVRWSMVFILPLAFVCTATEAGPGGPTADAAGRLSLTAAALLAAVFLAAALRPSGPLTLAIWAAYPNGRLRKTRFLWIPAAWLLPLALAVLAALGYYYTAQRLAECIAMTGYLVLGLVFLRALLLRCILVKRRFLAMEAARQRRAAMQAEEKPSSEGSLPSVVPTPSEPNLDLAKINIQARRLVEYSLLLGGAIGLWFIWVDVLPALSMLRRVEMWRSLDDARIVTLADVALAVLIGTTAFSAAKNIPGLLEMAWLRRLTLDSGLRYTLGTVSRYLITIVGVIVVSHVLGISWSKVQWLIAAISVGLGFGLQEIFANFVSGLIILFERPVRVGDIVTVADVTGVVSQIRMRATTITNWDRKEYIVPNKEFVTSRLLNWTLSDKVNRVVVEIGIAYGSDTRTAARILREVADLHPLILDDPEPSVTFEAFGDSALKFVLRCYLPDLENRLKTVHELHLEIDRRFREAKIEIAFPQQDVHVRSLPKGLRTTGAPSSEEVHLSDSPPRE